MEFILGFYVVVAITAWCIGLGGVALAGLAARELGATRFAILLVVSVTAALLVSPCYLMVLPAPKSVFVLLPLPVVTLTQGLGALAPRWQANLGFVIAVFAFALFVSNLLVRPNYSFKRTGAERLR